MKTIKVICWLLIALSALFVGKAFAASCSVSATSVAFGTYNRFSGAPNDSTGTVRITCDPFLFENISYDIRLSAGGAGSYSPRRMISGADRLNYNLYTGAARSRVWGNGAGGTSIVSDSYGCFITCSTRSYTVYGRIPAGQNPAAGQYTDVITVTVIY